MKNSEGEAMTSVTIQQFHQNVEAAEAAASAAPVVIMQDGAAKRVLMSIEEYRRILHMRIIEGIASPNDLLLFQQAGGSVTALSARAPHDPDNPLAVPDDEYFEWEPERLYLTTVPPEAE